MLLKEKEQLKLLYNLVFNYDGGLGENYGFSQKQMGNAISVNVVKKIFNNLLNNKTNKGLK